MKTFFSVFQAKNNMQVVKIKNGKIFIIFKNFFNKNMSENSLTMRDYKNKHFSMLIYSYFTHVL